MGDEISGKSKTEMSVRGAGLKLGLFSFLGIFMFFIKIPYQGTKKIPIDIITGIIRAKLEGVLPYVVLAVCVFGVFDDVILRKTYKKSKSNTAIMGIKVIGMLMVFCSVFQIGPAALIASDVGPYTVSLLGGPVGITLFVGSIVLPFLIDYGLAEMMGVLLRPIMRPVFKLPGRTAVVAITAFFGNFSLGHMGIEKMFKQGQITRKEAVIVGTGFSTASIVTMLVFANMAGIMEQWGLYITMTTLITFLTTAITVRVYPIRNKAETYCAGVKPDPEPVYDKHLIKNAFKEGINAAAHAMPVHQCILVQLRSVLQILGAMLSSGMFFMAGALLLQKYTPVVTWIGYIFWPFFKLVRMPDLDIVMQTSGLSLMDQSLSVAIAANAIAAGRNMAMVSRFYVAVMPVSMIVFFSGFVPSILATDIDIKIHELVFLWFIRVVLTILMVSVCGLLFWSA